MTYDQWKPTEIDATCRGLTAEDIEKFKTNWGKGWVQVRIPSQAELARDQYERNYERIFGKGQEGHGK